MPWVSAAGASTCPEGTYDKIVIAPLNKLTCSVCRCLRHGEHVVLEAYRLLELLLADEARHDFCGLLIVQGNAATRISTDDLKHNEAEAPDGISHRIPRAVSPVQETHAKVCCRTACLC